MENFRTSFSRFWICENSDFTVYLKCCYLYTLSSRLKALKSEASNSLSQTEHNCKTTSSQSVKCITKSIL